MLTKTHLVVYNIKQREGESTRAFITRYTDDTLQILGLHEEKRIFGFVHGLRTRSLVVHLSTDLPTTYKDQGNPLGIITEDRKAGIGSPHTKDLTMDFSPTCPKSQERSLLQNRQLEASNNLLIEEAVKLGQLYHLVKGIKKEKVKASENQQTEGKKRKITTPDRSTYIRERQPMYAPPNMPVYLNLAGSFADSTSYITHFVRWIEDFPLMDGLKMPSHIGSYDGKGDPDNFLHLFEGVIRMQKWLMPVACHMFIYTLKDSACIRWNSKKTCSILNYEDLKAKFWSHFSQQKKFTKTHLAVHNIKQREGESTRAFITRYTDDTLQILGLHEEQRISSFVYGLRTKSLVEHLSTYLPYTYKGLMEKTYTWIEAREVATSETPNDGMENFKRLRKSS
ncbi:reverse transcriptase domain-containing protein [Tanacetum coccineum]|uniref:Reverse transcriptase domain-containing protein n=1 Tax=Tanacetum coccineum TaxID=301880 RepID=A0ABQ5B7R6_9ASTR